MAKSEDKGNNKVTDNQRNKYDSYHKSNNRFSLNDLLFFTSVCLNLSILVRVISLRFVSRSARSQLASIFVIISPNPGLRPNVTLKSPGHYAVRHMFEGSPSDQIKSSSAGMRRRLVFTRPPIKLRLCQA